MGNAPAPCRKPIGLRLYDRTYQVGRDQLEKEAARGVEYLRQEIQEIPYSLSLVRQVERLCQALETTDPNLQAIVMLCSEVLYNLQAELESHLFFFIPPDRALLFRQLNMGWETALRQFPSTASDVDEAQKCYIAARPTACVFHLMRVLEVAIAAISKHLGVTKHSPTWNAYLEAFSPAVAAKYPKKDRSDSEMRIYFAGLEAQLRAIKDAWRNPTIHNVARVYTMESAQHVMLLVKAFMNEVGKHVSEASI